jgi:nucleoside-diphosphate-sugar epimerase
MKLLVGNTGLIGTTLKDSLVFDREYNRRNFERFYSEMDDVYLSCLPATKWLINQNPIEDYYNMMSIFNILKQFSYRKIVLFSTIDVYSHSPLKSNEKILPNYGELCYGSNRLIFESLIKTLECESLTILRLPGVYGKHIKKNVIYDLLNNNQVEKININSSYQWYDLSSLVDDVNKYQDGTYNLFPEPLDTADLLEIFNSNPRDMNVSSEKTLYDFQTIYDSTGYIYSKERTVEKLKKFISEYFNK